MTPASSISRIVIVIDFPKVGSKIRLESQALNRLTDSTPRHH